MTTVTCASCGEPIQQHKVKRPNVFRRRCPACRLAQQANYTALRNLEPSLLGMFAAARDLARSAVSIIESSNYWHRSMHRDRWTYGGVLDRLLQHYHIWSAILRLLEDPPKVCPDTQDSRGEITIPLPRGAWLELRAWVRQPGEPPPSGGA